MPWSCSQQRVRASLLRKRPHDLVAKSFKMFQASMNQNVIGREPGRGAELSAELLRVCGGHARAEWPSD